MDWNNWFDLNIGYVKWLIFKVNPFWKKGVTQKICKLNDYSLDIHLPPKVLHSCEISKPWSINEQISDGLCEVICCRIGYTERHYTQHQHISHINTQLSEVTDQCIVVLRLRILVFLRFRWNKTKLFIYECSSEIEKKNQIDFGVLRFLSYGILLGSFFISGFLSRGLIFCDCQRSCQVQKSWYVLVSLSNKQACWSNGWTSREILNLLSSKNTLPTQ